MRDLSLHIMDIVQNSISAEATCIKVSIIADDETGKLSVEIEDNGKGMDKDFAQRVTSPFVTTRSTRRVGLGIPLLQASAERAGGYLTIHSEPGSGTILRAVFQINHIDRLPLGDISETMTALIIANPDVHYMLYIKSNKTCFEFSTAEVKEKLGEVPITGYEVVAWIKDFIDDGIKNTFGGVLNEVFS